MKKIFQFKDYKNKKNLMKTELRKHLQEIDSQMNAPTNANQECTWEHFLNNKQQRKRFSVVANSPRNSVGFNVIKYGKQNPPSTDNIFESGFK